MLGFRLKLSGEQKQAIERKLLGFTFQKARFICDYLDEDKREKWLAGTWPKIFNLARKNGAYLFFS